MITKSSATMIATYIALVGLILSFSFGHGLCGTKSKKGTGIILV